MDICTDFSLLRWTARRLDDDGGTPRASHASSSRYALLFVSCHHFVPLSSLSSSISVSRVRRRLSTRDSPPSLALDSLSCHVPSVSPAPSLDAVTSIAGDSSAAVFDGNDACASRGCKSSSCDGDGSQDQGIASRKRLPLAKARDCPVQSALFMR